MRQEQRTTPDRRSNEIELRLTSSWDGKERRKSTRRMIETESASLADQLNHHLQHGQFGNPAATLKRMTESNAAIAVHQAFRSIAFSTGLPISRIYEIAQEEIDGIIRKGA